MKTMLRLSVLAKISFVVFAVAVLACVLAPLVTHYNPNDGDTLTILRGPSVHHLLGTDELGRDILTRLLYGGRATLEQAFVVLVVALLVGVVIGLVAGFAGGWIDRVIMVAVEIGMAVPAIIVTLVVVAVFNGHFLVVLAILGLFVSPPLVRNIRGSVLAVRQELFVEAARVGGLSETRIVFGQILPRITGPVLVQATLNACMAIPFTVGLAYLGFGVTPPDPSWGSMIAEGATVLGRSGWLLMISGIVTSVVVLAIGLFGDGLHDALIGEWAHAVHRPRASRSHRPVGAPTGAAPDPDALLSVRDLSIEVERPSGPVTVVGGVNLDIRHGEAVGLVGESGCGKTSVARALIRLLRAGASITSGSVAFEGRDVLALEPKQLNAYRGSSVAYIAQEPMAALDPSYRVEAHLAKAVRLHSRLRGAELDARIQELLAMVRLPDPQKVARLYPHEISGGMAQRVAIAMALAARPALLIADEPTTALDVTVQSEILELLNTLRAETGMAILLVSHDWGVIAQLCDRAIVMYAGQVVEDGDLREMLEMPAHPYTKALLTCRPTRATARDLPLPTIGGTVPEPGDWDQGCRFRSRCPWVVAACATTPVELVGLGTGRGSRCLRIEDVLDQGNGTEELSHV